MELVNACCNWGAASTEDTEDEGDVLSIQTIKAVNHPQTGGDTQRKNKGIPIDNFAMKPPGHTKSKKPMVNKEISQLEPADETSQTDNSGAVDMISQTDNDSEPEVDEDTGTEALARPGATSDNESSKVEKVPNIMKERKPKKKQPTQTARDRIQASRKEHSVKGFQRKVSICLITITLDHL